MLFVLRFSVCIENLTLKILYKVYYHFFNFLHQGVDIRVDSGLSLAFALWSRSEVLLELGDGENALSDLQYSLQNGLPAKQHGEYYLRMARANASNINID